MVEEQEAGFLSFDAVEARLVEAVGFLDRMPQRDGHRRITASDGPWGMILPEAWGQSVGGEGVSFEVALMQAEDARVAALRQRCVLTSAEVDRMNQALEWVTLHVPARGELRRIVGSTLARLAREGGRADWIEIRRRGRFKSSTEALRKSYSRAIGRIAARLNGCRGL